MNAKKFFKDCSSTYRFEIWNGESEASAMDSVSCCFNGIKLTETVMRIAEYFGVREIVEGRIWVG